jgi:hypothetical protein
MVNVVYSETNSPDALYGQCAKLSILMQVVGYEELPEI